MVRTASRSRSAPANPTPGLKGRGVELAVPVDHQQTRISACAQAGETPRKRRTDRSHDAARVEQCQQEFRIVRFELCEIAELAHLMPDDQWQIPERVEKPTQKRFVVGANGVVEEDEDVDVGMQRQVPPSVATQRDDSRGLRGRRRQEEQPLQERIDPVGVALEGDPVGGAARGLLDELLTRGDQPA